MCFPADDESFHRRESKSGVMVYEPLDTVVLAIISRPPDEFMYHAVIQVGKYSFRVPPPARISFRRILQPGQWMTSHGKRPNCRCLEVELSYNRTCGTVGTLVRQACDRSLLSPWRPLLLNGQLENISRFTADEMRMLQLRLQAELGFEERIFLHFTSVDYAMKILQNHGIRASHNGQAGGGVSLSRIQMHELGWEQFGAGMWNSRVSVEVWAETWQEKMPGGMHHDKLEAVLLVRLPENTEKYQLLGRPGMVIIPPSCLTKHHKAHDAPAGTPEIEFYLDRTNIIRAYDLRDLRVGSEINVSVVLKVGRTPERIV
jgi:hypothetical protein